MKYILYTIAMIFFFMSCKEKSVDNYLIEGKIQNLTDSVLYVVTAKDANTLKVDTVYSSIDGSFSFEGFSDTLSAIVIYMEEGNVWSTIWVKNKDKISLVGNAEYPESILAKGGEVNDLLSKFKGENQSILEQRRDLVNKKENIESADTNSTNSEYKEAYFISKIAKIDAQLRDKAISFIKKHPASVASLVIIQDYLINYNDPTDLKHNLSLISGEATKNVLYYNLLNVASKLEETAIGAKAPDFSAIDIKNDTISLNTFKNKYLLLTFAASWNDSCRKDNAELLKIQKKFKDKIGIVTVSIDEDKSAWEKIVKDEKLTWNHIVDGDGWNSKIISLYNINKIPSNLLINNENIIIAKNLPSDSILILLNDKLK